MCKRKANYSTRDFVKFRYSDGLFIPDFVPERNFVTGEARKVAEGFFKSHRYPGFVEVFAVRGRDLYRNPLHLAKLVSEIEIEAAHGQSRMNLGVRLGPAFGLVGTIIPMGPALSGLSSGNVEVIAGNLSVAFGTTILGLLISAVCYFISIGRRHWYARDISDIEYVCEFLHHERGEDE